MKLSTFVLAVSAAGAPALPAQAPSSDPRAFGTTEEEIRVARSAAPAHVSDEAAVLVLREGRYVVGRKGTTDVTCLVARSRPGSVEPICYDAEASRTIMQIEIRRNELRFAGTPDAEIDRVVAEAIGSAELQLPRRPALAYMMSSAQVLISDDGRNVGNWYPHLMLYVPYVSAADLGLYGSPSLEAAAVFDEGKPTAHVVIAVRAFVDPVGEDSASR